MFDKFIRNNLIHKLTFTHFSVFFPLNFVFVLINICLYFLDEEATMAMTDVEVTVAEEVVAIQEDHHHKEVGVVEEENLVVILVGVK